MSRALVLIAVIYVVAASVGIGIGHLVGERHPITVVAVADVAATVTVFLFSYLFGNSSIYDPYWSVAPALIALYWARIGRALVPNLQVFWISDAIYEGSAVPLKYVLVSGMYAACYTTAILALAIALFQRRQVG